MLSHLPSPLLSILSTVSQTSVYLNMCLFCNCRGAHLPKEAIVRAGNCILGIHSRNSGCPERGWRCLGPTPGPDQHNDEFIWRKIEETVSSFPASKFLKCDTNNFPPESSPLPRIEQELPDQENGLATKAGELWEASKESEEVKPESNPYACNAAPKLTSHWS